jgi:hypothetical protein
MKILFLLFGLLLSFPIISYANMKELPQPDSGLQVIPFSQMDITDKMKNETLLKLNEQSTKGFVNSNSIDAKHLLNFTQKQNVIYYADKVNSNPTDTHMRNDLSQIKLAFPVKALPLRPGLKIIGYAPIGTWLNKSWTGVKMFFTDLRLGVCEYSIINYSLSHGAIQIASEVVSYDINNKPTTFSIEGNEKTGYLYNISWFDKAYSRELQCAKLQFEPKLKNELIDFARNLDNG